MQTGRGAESGSELRKRQTEEKIRARKTKVVDNLITILTSSRPISLKHLMKRRKVKTM